MDNFGLYIVITNPVLDYPTFVRICVEEQIPMIQIREKNILPNKLINLARNMKTIVQGSKTKLIINDYPNIAVSSCADGVHLGPEDMTLEEAVKTYGTDLIYGVSTHSLIEAESFINNIGQGQYLGKPDYMSFGPIFPTPTKEKPDNPVGINNLSQIVKKAPIPVVAIGGLFPENIREVLDCGIKNIAMVRYFTKAQNVSELRDKIRHVQSIIKEYKS